MDNFINLFGSGSECHYECAKYIEMKVPKYSAKVPKTRAPIKQNCQNDWISLKSSVYY